jgi:hypothetical protein
MKHYLRQNNNVWILITAFLLNLTILEELSVLSNSDVINFVSYNLMTMNDYE